MQRRHFPEFVHLFGAEIADADRADLAGAIERAHGFRDLLNRCVGIRPVNLIEVDGVGLQAAEGILNLPDDAVLARVAEWTAALPVETDLGRNQRALAPTTCGECLSDDLLGVAEAVDGRRIDEIDTAIQRRVNRPDRVGLVAAAPHPAANCPGSKRNA